MPRSSREGWSCGARNPRPERFHRARTRICRDGKFESSGHSSRKRRLSLFQSSSVSGDPPQMQRAKPDRSGRPSDICSFRFFFDKTERTEAVPPSVSTLISGYRKNYFKFRRPPARRIRMSSSERLLSSAISFPFAFALIGNSLFSS